MTFRNAGFNTKIIKRILLTFYKRILIIKSFTEQRGQQMTSQYKFTEEALTELIGEDLTLSASLAELLNNNGDIRAFLVSKLEEREEIRAVFVALESQNWDWNQIQDMVDANEARYINQHHFGGL